MRLSQLGGNKLSFKDYSDKYVDVKVISASWKKTKKGNEYLSIELELCSKRKAFDKPVGIFSQKNLEDIIRKIGAEKYSEQTDPDVTDLDVVGLIFNAKISINKGGFTVLEDIELGDSSMSSAEMTEGIDAVMEQFTQQVTRSQSQSTVGTSGQDKHQNQMQTTSTDEELIKEQVEDRASNSSQQGLTDQLSEDDIEKELKALANTPVPEKKVDASSNNPFSNVIKSQTNPFE